MTITDNEIVNLTPFMLLSNDLLYSLQEVEEPEEKERLQALLELRARDLNMEKQFRRVIRQFNKANQSLADYYRRENAIQRATIDLEFDGTGRPLSTVENFLRVIENDPKFYGLKFNLLTYSPEQERNGKTERWLDALEAIPAADVRPVVRCKECKHCFVDGDNVRFNVCELNHNRVQADDWFCADGERKGGDE